MRQFRWGNYLICLAPLPLLAYLGLESYGIDFRAFYLAGKAALAGLNPYLNQIAISPAFYGPINAELAQYSGWKYPPLATYLFTGLASLPYESAKTLFNAVSVAVATGAICVAIHRSGRTLPPESILLAGISFPVLTTLERGQVELLLTVAGVICATWLSRERASAGGILLALLSGFKIYPLLIATGLLTGPRRTLLKTGLILAITLALLVALTHLLCPADWVQSFNERLHIPFDQVPGQVLPHLPAGSGVIEGTASVRSADARVLIHSHDFVFGFGNPLLRRTTLPAALLGLAGACAALRSNRNQPPLQQYLSVMPWINIANPLAWTMGVCWYIPLFLYHYPRVSAKARALLALPLILPPFLNASCYLAAALSLVVTKLDSKPSLNQIAATS